MSTQVESGSTYSPLFLFVTGVFSMTLALAVILLQSQAVFMVVGLLFFILFIKHPVLGVYVTTALLLLSGSQGIVGFVGDSSAMAVTLSKLSGSAALAAWIINMLMRKSAFEFNSVALWLCMFCGWALACTLVSRDMPTQLTEWVRLMTILGFFLLSINTLNSPRTVHLFIVILLLCGIVMSVVALLQFMMPSQHMGGEGYTTPLGAVDAAYVDQESLQGGPAIRASGRSGHSNWLAFSILLILPLNVYWFQCVKSRSLKVFIVLGVAAELMALVVTFTRTGFVVGVVLAVLMLTKKLVHLTPHRFVAFLLAVVFLYAMLPTEYKERVFTPKQYTRSTSVESRLQLQKSALHYAAANPVFGLGMGGFGINFIHENSVTARTMRYMVYHQEWNALFVGTHNMILEIAANTGLVGLVLFICFYVLLLRKLISAEWEYERVGDTQGAALASALFVSLVGFLLCSIFLHALTQKIWWMIAAAATVLPLYNMSFKTGVLTQFHTTTDDPRLHHGKTEPVAAPAPSPGA